MSGFQSILGEMSGEGDGNLGLGGLDALARRDKSSLNGSIVSLAVIQVTQWRVWCLRQQHEISGPHVQTAVGLGKSRAAAMRAGSSQLSRCIEYVLLIAYVQKSEASSLMSQPQSKWSRDEPLRLRHPRTANPERTR